MALIGARSGCGGAVGSWNKSAIEGAASGGDFVGLRRFITTIMTAMMWVGALNFAIVYWAPKFPRWIGAWCVAVCLVITRWVMLWHSGGSRSGLLTAMRYPSTPDLALSVGLVALPAGAVVDRRRRWQLNEGGQRPGLEKHAASMNL